MIFLHPHRHHKASIPELKTLIGVYALVGDLHKVKPLRWKVEAAIGSVGGLTEHGFELFEGSFSPPEKEQLPENHACHVVEESRGFDAEKDQRLTPHGDVKGKDRANR